MIQDNGVKFTSENIRKIFGTVDGEGEDIGRLSEYYLKTDVYDSVIANLPVLILVGNKGVGKSALFRIALKEAKELNKIPVLIKPDHIAEIGEKHESLMISIRKWKYGLAKILVKKIIQEFGLYEDLSIDPIRFGGKIKPQILEALNIFESKGVINLERKEEIIAALDSKSIEVYFDDMDRGWQNRSEGLIMISALINSIRDMASENDGFLFKVALRTDVYAAVRTDDESSDKFDGMIVHYTHTLHELFVLLIKRILTFRKESFDERNLLRSEQKYIAYNIESIFEKTFFGKGMWENQPMYKVLLSLIRNRPRDLIKLCTMAAKEAHRQNANKISTKHIEEILPEYSKVIIDDTIAEYKSELKDIHRLIYGMKPIKKERNAADVFIYSSAELRQKLFNLIQQNNFRFASGLDAKPQDLINFLFKIGFLTARKTMGSGEIVRKNFEQANNLAMPNIDFGFDWEVHLCYRWAIQPDTLETIFARL